MVWGTADHFFELKWAYWLVETIPGAQRVVEVPDGKLFFPDERPDELVAALRDFWS
ncbi:alpha/beta fold hydrolase [Fodinicola feengrottensis]|uniref:alpha/beta fold hydrolase n=1 Tax=Fodinicola feengrottensis TaxID=435914 RepID=UPI0024421F10|nr:alpha/beta hydrolase [Fodinicola feengrottensis]